MVAKKKKIAASKPGAPPASSPVTGKKKTIHATTTTTTGDDHRAHRAQEQQQKQKQQQQPPQQQQQQQRVSRLGKAVQDAATIKKKPKNKGQHQHQAKKKSTVIPMMNRMDSRVDPSRMGKNRSREGTSERLTPRTQSQSQQRMPAPRRPGGIDASMLSSPHRVTSP